MMQLIVKVMVVPDVIELDVNPDIVIVLVLEEGVQVYTIFPNPPTLQVALVYTWKSEGKVMTKMFVEEIATEEDMMTV